MKLRPEALYANEPHRPTAEDLADEAMHLALKNRLLLDAVKRILDADDDQCYTCEADGRPALENLRAVFNSRKS
jgi:hypothetical protein